MIGEIKNISRYNKCGENKLWNVYAQHGSFPGFSLEDSIRMVKAKSLSFGNPAAHLLKLSDAPIGFASLLYSSFASSRKSPLIMTVPFQHMYLETAPQSEYF